jgi:hypothetical protein
MLDINAKHLLIMFFIMAFDISNNCVAGCANPDTSACVTNPWGTYAADPGTGLNPYGYLGEEYKEFVYGSETGALQLFKPGPDGRTYFQDMLEQAVPLTIIKTMKQKAAAVSYLLFDDVQINELYNLDVPEKALNESILKFKSITTPTGDAIRMDPFGQFFIWAEEEDAYSEVYILSDVTSASDSFNVVDRFGKKPDLNHPTFKGKYIVGDQIKISRVNPAAKCGTGHGGSCCPDILLVDVTGVDTSNANYVKITYDADTSGAAYGPATTTFSGAFGTYGTQTYTFATRAAYNTAGGCLNDEKYPDLITITITADEAAGGATTTFTTGRYQGDKVEFWGHAWDPCTPIVSSAIASQQGWVRKKTNIKYYARTLEIPFEIKNIQFVNGGAQKFLARQIQLMTISLVEEFANDFYISSDRARYRNGGKGPATTSSLLGTLLRGNAQHPELRLIRSAARVSTPEEKAYIFLETLEAIQQSLYTPNNPLITVIFDDKGYNTWMKLGKAFSNLIGEIRIASDIETKNFAGVKKVITPYGDMEVMKDYFFTKAVNNSGNALFLVKDNIGSLFAPWREVNLSDGGQLSLTDVSPRIQIQDVTPTGVHGCQRYDLRFNNANVFLSGDKGAMYRLTGFALN